MALPFYTDVEVHGDVVAQNTQSRTIKNQFSISTETLSTEQTWSRSYEGIFDHPSGEKPTWSIKTGDIRSLQTTKKVDGTITEYCYTKPHTIQGPIQFLHYDDYAENDTTPDAIFVRDYHGNGAARHEVIINNGEVLAEDFIVSSGGEEKTSLVDLIKSIAKEETEYVNELICATARIDQDLIVSNDIQILNGDVQISTGNMQITNGSLQLRVESETVVFGDNDITSENNTYHCNLPTKSGIVIITFSDSASTCAYYDNDKKRFLIGEARQSGTYHYTDRIILTMNKDGVIDKSRDFTLSYSVQIDKENNQFIFRHENVTYDDLVSYSAGYILFPIQIIK